jgi:hypothetical protein
MSKMLNLVQAGIINRHILLVGTITTLPCTWDCHLRFRYRNAAIGGRTVAVSRRNIAGQRVEAVNRRSARSVFAMCSQSRQATQNTLSA